MDRASLIARERNLPLLLYFYTPEEKWCFSMELYTFCDPKVVSTIHQNFLPIRLQRSEHPRLLKTYGVKRFPTLLFLTPSQEEIDRVDRFVDAVTFLRFLERVIQGENTFLYWKNRAGKGSEDPIAWFQLAERHLSREMHSESQAYYRKIIALPSTEPPLLREEAELGYAFSVGQSGRRTKAIQLLQEFCARNPSSPLQAKARFSIGLTYLFSNKDRKAESQFREVALHYGETPLGRKALIMAEELKMSRENREEPKYILDWESGFLGQDYSFPLQDRDGKKKRK